MLQESESSLILLLNISPHKIYQHNNVSLENKHLNYLLVRWGVNVMSEGRAPAPRRK